MDIFSTINGIKEDELHMKFRLLRDEYAYIGARNIVESWAEGFVDRDNKIRKEFQTTFHSSLWEFYLYAVLRKMGFDIDMSKDFPDFIINGKSAFYIEAVVSEIKDGGRPESDRTLDDQISMLRPISSKMEFSEIIDEAITRHSNSLISKLEKYTGFLDKKGKWKKGYKDYDWVSVDRPFAIALGSYDQVNYGREYIYSIVALLYGIYFDPEKNYYKNRDFAIKPGSDTKIPLGLFNQERFKDVSAVMFSNTLTLGKLSSLARSSGDKNFYVINVRYDFEYPNYKIHEVCESNPESLVDGLYIFLNPNARVAFPKEIIDYSGIVAFSLDEYGLAFEGGHPLVARYCAPSILVNKELVKSIAATNYNKTIAFDILRP